MERGKQWARSRRGVVSILGAAALLAYLVGRGVVRPVLVPLAAVVVLGVGAAVVWVLAAMWEDWTMPATPRWARGQQGAAPRQFREDGNARVFSDRGGFLFERRWFFAGTGCPPVRLSAAFVADARARKGDTPVLVAHTSARRFWWYEGGFAWENQDLSARDVLALIHKRRERAKREMATAHSLLDIEQGRAAAAPRQRQPIPRDVQNKVFARDGGCCVECRSDADLQFDHVIPFSRGGADSVQNLQLLCARCNLSKGANF